jgi:hypothetical protein
MPTHRMLQIRSIFNSSVSSKVADTFSSVAFLSDAFFFNLHNGGWSPNWVHSARGPLTGLLYLPRVIVKMENSVE